MKGMLTDAIDTSVCGREYLKFITTTSFMLCNSDADEP